MKRLAATPLGLAELTLLLLAALGGGCLDRPTYEGRLCDANGDCPDDYLCGPDLRCHSVTTGESQDPGQLPEPPIDGGLEKDPSAEAPPPAGDAGVAMDAGTATTSTVPPQRKNPFVGASFYENPEFAQNVERSAALAPPEERARIGALRSVSTAVWIETISDVATVEGHLARADGQATRVGSPVAIMFVLSNFPNRNCPSTDGELFVAEGGEARYKNEVLEPFITRLAQHPNLRVVVILEPGVLPHLVTGGSIETCAAVAPVHRALLAHTIDRLSSLANVSLYLELAHGSWLGWPNHRRRAAVVVRELFEGLGGPKNVRGFTVNVANYNVLRAGPELFDYGMNPCHDEHTYVSLLAQDLAVEGIEDARFIIDTSRNGRAGIRREWSAYCNVRGAGLGERPRARPAPHVDAYFWIKTPGESDGTTDPASPAFNPDCTRMDSVPTAPEAGRWFHEYFLELTRNAGPPL